MLWKIHKSTIRNMPNLKKRPTKPSQWLQKLWLGESRDKILKYAAVDWWKWKWLIQSKIINPEKSLHTGTIASVVLIRIQHLTFLTTQPHSQGLSSSRRETLVWAGHVPPDFSRFHRCDWREGLGKVKVCLALSLPTEPSREWNLQPSRCVDRQKSQQRHWHIRCRSSIPSMFG